MKCPKCGKEMNYGALLANAYSRGLTNTLLWTTNDFLNKCHGIYSTKQVEKNGGLAIHMRKGWCDIPMAYACKECELVVIENQMK